MWNTGPTKRLVAALFGLALITASCSAADDSSSAKFEEVSESISDSAGSSDDAGGAEELEMSDSPGPQATAVPASFQDEGVGADEAPIEAEPEANPVIRTVIRRATMHL